jgi:hypothetical protein
MMGVSGKISIGKSAFAGMTFLQANLSNFAQATAAMRTADTANSAHSIDLTLTFCNNAQDRKGAEAALQGSVSPSTKSVLYS